MSKTSVRIGIFATVITAALAVGCGGKSNPLDEANANGVLMIGNGAEPRDLDPHVVTGFPENRVIKALLEGLVTEHPQTSAEVLPGMAERWESNSGATRWTFYLREALWSNGDPVTAQDFLFAYERLLNPEFGAPYASMLFHVRGAEAYNNGEITDFAEVGFSAPDERTLVVETYGPTPFLPLMLTHYTWFPVHPPTIEKHDAGERRDSGWTQPGNYIGNGPFVLTEWRPNQRIIVEKNPLHWDAATVSLNAIQFFPVQDSQAEQRMFQTGMLHKTDSVPYNMRDRLRASADPAFREDPMFATGYMGLNTANGPLADVRVRRALSLALDRSTIINNVTKNGNPAGGFVPPTIPGYASADSLPFDPERARALLSEAGFPGGEGFPSLEFLIPHSDTSRTFAEVAQEMWRRELGIDVQVLNKEWQVLIANMDSGDFDLFLISWIGDYLDPATFLKILRTGDGNNRTGFANPQFDALLAQANQQRDLLARFDLLAQAEAILLDQLPILPLTWSDNLFLLHPSVTGWQPKPLMDQPYKYVRLDPVSAATEATE